MEKPAWKVYDKCKNRDYEITTFVRGETPGSLVVPENPVTDTREIGGFRATLTCAKTIATGAQVHSDQISARPQQARLSLDQSAPQTLRCNTCVFSKMSPTEASAAGAQMAQERAAATLAQVEMLQAQQAILKAKAELDTLTNQRLGELSSGEGQ